MMTDYSHFDATFKYKRALAVTLRRYNLQMAGSDDANRSDNEAGKWKDIALCHLGCRECGHRWVALRPQVVRKDLLRYCRFAALAKCPSIDVEQG
jgi:hypothetical protein